MPGAVLQISKFYWADENAKAMKVRAGNMGGTLRPQWGF